MNCSKCGYEISKDKKFCTNCGKKIIPLKFFIAVNLLLSIIFTTLIYFILSRIIIPRPIISICDLEPYSYLIIISNFLNIIACKNDFKQKILSWSIAIDMVITICICLIYMLIPRYVYDSIIIFLIIK